MGLRDKFRKRGDATLEEDEKAAAASNNYHSGSTPEFTFVRSDTSTMEVIHPGDDHGSARRGDDASHLSPTRESSSQRRSLSIFHSSSRSRSPSVSSQASLHSSSSPDKLDGARRKRLSERLHLRHHQPESSDSVPANLPAILVPPSAGKEDAAAVESQWEQRATLLAGQNEIARSAPGSPLLSESMASLNMQAGAAPGSPMAMGAPGSSYSGGGGPGSRSRSRSPSGTQIVSSKAIDDDIQEAIRLHEEGDLKRSTEIFGRLADSNGANNPLSQVLYGLALRHGWGCTPDTEKAVTYLSAAASNAASVEELALQAGMKKGGAAKGELILAIFELANCFRHGWGIPQDPVAAKQYYETAANLGDSDAMNEAAWCYLEGFGCKKDKFAAAQYYRLAEKAGNKTLGNTWIWKEKYDPGEGKGKGKKKR